MKFTPHLFFLLLFSCQGKPDITQKAAANRSELAKVISFYSEKKEDSLKLRAAKFLISNMEGKFSLVGEGLQRFFKFCDSISNQSIPPTAYKQAFIAFETINGSMVGQPAKMPDLESISSAYLIKNIEEAFTSWDQAAWKGKVTFDDFCEYILPYRIGNESFEDFRTALHRKYKFGEISQCNMQMAADSILSRTRSPGMFLFQFPDNVPSFPISVLQHLKGGTCIESSSLSIYIMRSFGLPVAQDFTLQWPHRANGHAWSALVISKDSCIDFEGVNAGKIGGHLLINTGNKIAKVYRRMYSRQPGSLAIIHGNEEIPEIFDDPCLKDVSSCYYNGVSVAINYDGNLPNQRKFAYLCVFDNANWTPICWAEAKDGKIIFKGMGKNIVYLPAIYVDGKFKPIAPPQKVDSLGSVYALVPQATALQTFYLKRKYPIFDWWDSRTLALIGGRFQASNKADFSDAVDIYRITQAPEMNYQTVKVTLNSKFRYWRYLPRDSTYGDIAELQFFDTQDQQVTGHPIGSQQSDPENGLQTAFDGNPLTFFQGLTSMGNWVGMRFDTPKKLSKIKFLCRNDDNFINQSDMYELFCWNNEQWQSLGTRTGDSTQMLIFDHVPGNGLYLLHDQTRGKEERIFTFENGKQIWW
ncbi:hypothetical protein Q4E93_17010 [Flavitalea sp. BT771]|uniref:hypothetical protein n=1 Tax=Flavitalea sp. BT771 TaxID=3063329 RepID=UPI0026E27CE5|nr:hypothetical protein [Flavitalea sp. BT771]MDO6432305.1 hypothetical protein [Flavitalea sp. BT771]MDV6221215.1 hypothetical protein [Flavitalea sp. BT771]